MAARAARAAGTARSTRTARGARGAAPRGARGEGGAAGESSGPRFGVPSWAWWSAAAVVLVALVGWGGYALYGALDRLYPQELWRYFRPASEAAAGSVLYRDLDGHLLLAPVGNPTQARRLTAETQEVVRDALFLPAAPGAQSGAAAGQAIAVYSTTRRSGQAESDQLKVLGGDGAVRLELPLAEAVGEPLLPYLYVSQSGRFLALTTRDRARVYYFDLAAGGAPAAGQADAPPEPVQWHRNGDLRQAPFAGEAAYALAPDGKRRAQVRSGPRQAPACGEAQCERVTELAVAPHTVTGGGPAAAGFALYGAFSSFSAEGFGPLPAQPADRFYGRLVWSPDGSQLLFTALDGDQSRVYAVGTDGRTRPSLVLDAAEALDWIP